MRVASPRLQARSAGFLYVLVIFLSLFAEAFVRDGLIVRGDAAATAHNILSAEFLFRLGFAADVFSAAAYIGVTVLLYVLLKPVGRSVATLGAFLGLTGSAVMAANMLNLLAALNWLGVSGGAFSVTQLEILAYGSLRLHGLGYSLSIVFFGMHLISLGYLILKARFLPRIIGGLLAVAGVFYEVNSFSVFLFAHGLPYALLPGLIAEGALALWLLFMGLDETKWRAQAVVASQT